ncbi:MAG: HD domain-containing protein [Nakamurella sp.]
MISTAPKSERLASAVQYAADAHAGQVRKRSQGDDRPPIRYLSHLLGVAGIVAEDLGTDDEIIAGLLHDVLEDQDPDGTRAVEINDKFGPEVLVMVESASGPKKEDAGMREFRVRKQVYLNQLQAEQHPGAIKVSLADKVHNARSTVNDLEAEGPAVWDRFNAGVDDQLWWYGGLAEVYAAHATAGRASTARAAELARLVARMGELSTLTASR